MKLLAATALGLFRMLVEPKPKSPNGKCSLPVSGETGQAEG